MEVLAAIGPYTEQMRAEIESRLPAGIEIKYIEDYAQYELLQDADYILLRTLRLTKEHIQTLRRTKLIQRWGAGYDTVDIRTAGEQGIPVAAAVGVNAQSVAELSVAFMLALYRRLFAQSEAYAGGEDRRVELSKNAYCIAGKTVGILGMGNIGRKVAGIVRAFGAEVVYYDALRMEPEKERTLGVRYAPLDEIWGQADILSLHLPALEETKGIVCVQTLCKMKRGAILINAARQELVAEKDLAEALRSGHLLGAGLDELAEPFPQSPLYGLDNVLCTPHIGGSTADIAAAMAERCMGNIALVQSGKKLSPPALVNAAFLRDGECV